jgi:DNA-binding NarL/FixJ family response regulator
MQRTRILIVDDHPVVRRGVAATLGDLPDWEVCGELSSGREALAVVSSTRPDIVVMDVSMPDLNGIEATRQILAAHPQVQVLILTMHESEQLVRDVLASGARGYLLKTDAGNELIHALQALREHRMYFTTKVAEAVLRGYLEGGPAADPGPLSPREREIVQLIAEGKSNKEVAAILHITIKTVETHRAHIMNKLGLHSVADLVRYAIRNKLTEC